MRSAFVKSLPVNALAARTGSIRSGRVAPRLAVERDVADRPAECAVHELAHAGNPTVDIRASEVAPFEPRLTGPDAV